MTLQGKIIDITNFKNDIIADAIDESWIDFEDIRDGKGELIKPKSSEMKIGINGKIAYTTNLSQGKTVVVCPYLMSSESIRQV